MWVRNGLPRWLSGKESACQCRRHRFNPWVGKIPWRRKWQPSPVFLPGNSIDRGAWWATVRGVAESDTTEQLSTHACIPKHWSLEVEWLTGGTDQSINGSPLCCCRCCCYVASVVSNSVWPHRRQPTRLPVPGILQARALEWVAISFSDAWKWKVKVKSLSRVWLLATPWTAAYQAPLSMGFSRQEHWSGVPLPSPRKLSINGAKGKESVSLPLHLHY